MTLAVSIIAAFFAGIAIDRLSNKLSSLASRSPGVVSPEPPAHSGAIPRDGGAL